MSELKPCPFCGGEADEYEGEYGNGIYCMECGAMVGEPIHLGFDIAERVSYEQAVEAWNTRAAVEFDNWFYMPKPKEPIVEVTETTHAWDGTKVKTDVYYQIQEQAIVAWARELDEHITKRICEVWNPERTCRNTDDDCDAWFECSECGLHSKLEIMSGGYGIPNYCPNCGAKVVSE